MDFDLPDSMKEGFFKKNIVVFNKKVLRAFNKNYFWVLEHNGNGRQTSSGKKKGKEDESPYQIQSNRQAEQLSKVMQGVVQMGGQNFITPAKRASVIP